MFQFSNYPATKARGYISYKFNFSWRGYACGYYIL